MKKAFLIIMIIYYSSIIWSFSAQPAVESATESKSITSFLYDKISVYSKKIRIMGKDDFVRKTDKIIRKCAHFILFFVFSIILYGYVNCFGRDDLVSVLTVLVAGVIVAGCDEIHQLFVEGRGGQLRDVLLDSSGVMAGGFLSSFIKNMLRRSNCK